MAFDGISRTDKGESGYIPTYEALAQTLPPDPSICELGVYQGGSLELWQSLFPSAQVIVGVDRNPESIWPAGTVKVVANQQDPWLAGQLRVHARLGFHLIVDDASHLGHPTLKAFQHLWPLVRPGGYYVIEDWCVGFPLYPNYDDSMLSLAMMLLNQFEYPTNDTEQIQYRYGLIILRKKEEG